MFLTNVVLVITDNYVLLDGPFVLLKAEKENKFSIYVHSRPGFLFNEATTRSAYFLNRQVNNSIQVIILPK